MGLAVALVGMRKGQVIYRTRNLLLHLSVPCAGVGFAVALVQKLQVKDDIGGAAYDVARMHNCRLLR
jgi:hypothetical protein